MPGIFDTGIFDTGIFDNGLNYVQPSNGGGAPIWSEVSWFRKKKPKKEEIVQDIVETVEEAVPSVAPDDTRLIALRIAEQMTIRQLRQLKTLDDFIARVEAEIAELDDEEVLLLAA